MRVASNLQQALRDDRFLLYCQAIEPLTPANDSRSVEILLRGIDADGEAVPPGEFLPQAEQNRLMPAIDRWVIRNAFDALAYVPAVIAAFAALAAMGVLARGAFRARRNG